MIVVEKEMVRFGERVEMEGVFSEMLEASP